MRIAPPRVNVMVTFGHVVPAGTGKVTLSWLAILNAVL